MFVCLFWTSSHQQARIHYRYVKYMYLGIWNTSILWRARSTVYIQDCRPLESVYHYIFIDREAVNHAFNGYEYVCLTRLAQAFIWVSGRWLLLETPLHWHTTTYPFDCIMQPIHIATLSEGISQDSCKWTLVVMRTVLLLEQAFSVIQRICASWENRP